ncbi:MAG: hypothetical protein H6R34_188 [Bacteroidetes bacterium]|nr:hypothetical protein [Bacteroidota bacterium]
MNFEHDIFISYGAAGKQDNQDGAAWAQLFCNHLDVVLQRLFDEKPSVLLQNELLTRQQQMNENPVDVFKKTGVFVVIISPEDIGSDDYMKELGRIYEAVYPSPGDNQTRNRIFKVLTLPLQDEKELELMKAELRYNFYEINRYNKKPLTYPLQGNQLPDDKFWSKLVDLAYDIYNSLQEIKEPGKVVHSESNHRTIGEFIKNAKYSLIDFQARVVKEFIESKEKCLKPYQIIWIPSDLKTTDQRQSLYLKRIKRDETQEKTEIIEAPLEVFKTIVNNKLNELAVAPVMTSETGYSLYLICEETEKPDLQDYINLIQSRGFRILTSVPAEKEYYSITEHIRLLKKADAVLIYKGDSSMEWLNSKLRDLVKVPGFGKEKPFKAIGIFSPQKTTDKSLLFLRNVTVIWNEEINNTAIHHFLDQIIKK